MELELLIGLGQLEQVQPVGVPLGDDIAEVVPLAGRRRLHGGTAGCAANRGGELRSLSD